MTYKEKYEELTHEYRDEDVFYIHVGCPSDYFESAKIFYCGSFPSVKNEQQCIDCWNRPYFNIKIRSLNQCTTCALGMTDFEGKYRCKAQNCMLCEHSVYDSEILDRRCRCEYYQNGFLKDTECPYWVEYTGE